MLKEILLLLLENWGNQYVSHSPFPDCVCTQSAVCLEASICSWQFDSFLCLFFDSLFSFFLSHIPILLSWSYGMPAAFFYRNWYLYDCYFPCTPKDFWQNNSLYLLCKNTEKMICRSEHSCFIKDIFSFVITPYFLKLFSKLQLLIILLFYLIVLILNKKLILLADQDTK